MRRTSPHKEQKSVGHAETKLIGQNHKTKPQQTYQRNIFSKKPRKLQAKAPLQPQRKTNKLKQKVKQGEAAKGLG